MRVWRTGIVVGLAVLAACATSPRSSAYHFHAAKWPNGVVPYYNAAVDQSWAVSQAVTAWNTSGAKVRFVEVSRDRAKLVIQEKTDGVYCAEGRASVGYYPHGAFVSIFPARGITHACNRYWAARVMTHELGHVLGLQHEDRFCAEMNASGSLRGGDECVPQMLWDWRCRLLEADDIAGAVAAYGGAPRTALGPDLCPLYGAIAPPRNLRARYDPATSRVTLTFVRPAAPLIPDFAVPVPWQARTSFAISPVPGSGLEHKCSPRADSAEAPHFRWHVQPGGMERLTTSLSIDAACYAVWAVDALGRPSTRPAVVRVPVA
jgi:hypothetical protein